MCVRMVSSVRRLTYLTAPVQSFVLINLFHTLIHAADVIYHFRTLSRFAGWPCPGRGCVAPVAAGWTLGFFCEYMAHECLKMHVC